MRPQSDFSRWMTNAWCTWMSALVAIVLAVALAGAAVAHLPLLAVAAAAALFGWLRSGYAVAVRVERDRVIVHHPLRRVVVTTGSLRRVDVHRAFVNGRTLPMVAFRTRYALPAFVPPTGWTDDAVLRTVLRGLVDAAGPAVVAPGEVAAVHALLPA